jgi:hypothetical protein
MSKNASFLINCRTWHTGNLLMNITKINVVSGILDAILTFLVVVLWIIVSVVEKIVLWFFIALFVDEYFGSKLREENWTAILPGSLHV